MICMTKADAVRSVRSLAPGVSAEAVDWGADLMLTVSRARGGQSEVDLDRAWVKALEVSTKPYAGALLDAMMSVPPKPQLLPAGWEEAVQTV